MSAIILLNEKRAEAPYELKDIRRRVYSIEELCYFIYSNVLICDRELLKEDLYEWIREECGCNDLYASLIEIRKQGKDAWRIAATIFAYTDYLNKQEREAVCERIRKASMLSVEERKKSRTDLLFLDGRYDEALKGYEELLLKEGDQDTKFTHYLTYDIACCYGRLFYFDIAKDWFEKAAASKFGDDADKDGIDFCERMMNEE